MLLNNISGLLAGFSVVSAVILLCAYLFFLPDMRKSLPAKVSCTLVLLGLALLQIAHYQYFISGIPPLELRAYCVLLMILPASFFFFGREVLFPETRYHWYDALHVVPVIASFVIPIKFAPGLAFVFGTAYTFWFARTIYQLRDQRGRFKFEMFFFGMFAVMALVALILGLALPVIDPSVFYFSYGNAISVAMILVVAALLFFPELLSDILLIAELAYAKSKLGGIDAEAKISELERLMVYDKQYENEGLSLAMVADSLELSSHQLSELINTEYGYGFPRFVREHRLRAAKALLISEPDSSVLSISMMTGFRSQSNFYTAFKELTGESPGNYRRSRLP